MAKKKINIKKYFDKQFDTRHKTLGEINEARWDYYIEAVRACYKKPEYRAPRNEVMETLEGFIRNDAWLDALTKSYVQQWPLDLQSISSPSTLQNVAIQSIRKEVRETRAEDSLTLFSAEELQELMYEALIIRHGEEPLPVSDPLEPRKPRSKWPHFRFIKHMQPSDIRAAMSTRQQLERDLHRSTGELEILDKVAQKANPDAYRRNMAIEVIFRLTN